MCRELHNPHVLVLRRSKLSELDLGESAKFIGQVVHIVAFVKLEGAQLYTRPVRRPDSIHPANEPRDEVIVIVDEAEFIGLVEERYSLSPYRFARPCDRWLGEDLLYFSFPFRNWYGDGFSFDDGELAAADPELRREIEERERLLALRFLSARYVNLFEGEESLTLCVAEPGCVLTTLSSADGSLAMLLQQAIFVPRCDLSRVLVFVKAKVQHQKRP